MNRIVIVLDFFCHRLGCQEKFTTATRIELFQKSKFLFVILERRAYSLLLLVIGHSVCFIIEWFSSGTEVNYLLVFILARILKKMPLRGGNFVSLCEFHGMHHCLVVTCMFLVLGDSLVGSDIDKVPTYLIYTPMTTYLLDFNQYLPEYFMYRQQYKLLFHWPNKS